MASRAYLGACLCFKDAALYLSEWLAFYAVLGVEHFYLCDNESTDNFIDIVAPYVANGTATVIRYPGCGVQQGVYAHCLANFGARTRWLIFCDDDEFLFPVEDISLPEALAPFECYAGIAVSWLLFGSAGHKIRPPGLVIENYRFRFGAADPHVKCIVDPAKIIEPLLIGHQFRCRGSDVIVNEYGVPMRTPFNKRPSIGILRINHYIAKSREELVQRRQRRQANTGEVSSLTVAQWIEEEAKWNHVEDTAALRYVPRIKAVMSRRRG